MFILDRRGLERPCDAIGQSWSGLVGPVTSPGDSPGQVTRPTTCLPLPLGRGRIALDHLDSLSEMPRLLLWLRRGLGMSCRETAEILSIPERSAKRLIREGAQRLVARAPQMDSVLAEAELQMVQGERAPASLLRKIDEIVKCAAVSSPSPEPRRRLDLSASPSRLRGSGADRSPPGRGGVKDGVSLRPAYAQALRRGTQSLRSRLSENGRHCFGNRID